MRIGVNASRLVLAAIGIVAFQILASLHLINTALLSSPIGATTHLWLALTGRGDILNFYENLSITLTELALAYLAVIIIGVPTGIILGWKRSAGDVLQPLIIAFFSIPSILLYPLIYLILGLGIESKIAFGIIVGVFAVLENCEAGARQVNRELLRLAASLGFTKSQTMWKILIPSALPSIIAGLRFGLSLTLIGIVAGEILASTSGIGQLLTKAFGLFKTDDLFALIIVVVGIATVCNLLLASVEARVNRFRMINIGKQ